MARPRGLEPLTPRSEVWCSIQLSYGRANLLKIFTQQGNFLHDKMSKVNLICKISLLCYPLPTMIRWTFLFLGLLTLFGGCSHLDSRCPEVNWYEVGRQDSTMGYSLERSLSERQQICHLAPDSVLTKAYINGFNAGLREYCNFKTGYTYGLSRIKKQRNACPKFLGRDFSRGYQAGARMAEIQQLQEKMKEKMTALENLIQNREQMLSKEESSAKK